MARQMVLAGPALEDGGPCVGSHPVVDADGRLHFAGESVRLVGRERQLAGTLVENFRRPVPGSELMDAAWPEGPPTHRAFHTRFMEFRRRIAPLGLVLRARYPVGFVLEPATRVPGEQRQKGPRAHG